METCMLLCFHVHIYRKTCMFHVISLFIVLTFDPTGKGSIKLPPERQPTHPYGCLEFVGQKLGVGAYTEKLVECTRYGDPTKSYDHQKWEGVGLYSRQCGNCYLFLSSTSTSVIVSASALMNSSLKPKACTVSLCTRSLMGARPACGAG